MFEKYEGNMRSKNDRDRLRQLSDEGSKKNYRKISDDLKDQIFQNQVLSSS
jgi:hypothetical protein